MSISERAEESLPPTPNNKKICPIIHEDTECDKNVQNCDIAFCSNVTFKIEIKFHQIQER